jgi:hypothetical protein
MKAKERRKLNSEVRIYNMYDTIIDKSEFNEKDYDTRRAMLTYWRDKYTNIDIMKGMGITGNVAFSKLLKELNIKTKSRNKRTKNIASGQASVPETQMFAIPDNVSAPIKLLNSGLHLEYNGDYEAEEISKILTKLQLLVEGETSKYTVHFSIDERK